MADFTSLWNCHTNRIHVQLVKAATAVPPIHMATHPRIYSDQGPPDAFRQTAITGLVFLFFPWELQHHNQFSLAINITLAWRQVLFVVPVFIVRIKTFSSALWIQGFHRKWKTTQQSKILIRAPYYLWKIYRRTEECRLGFNGIVCTLMFNLGAIKNVQHT